MDRVRKSVAFVGVTTYRVSFDFFDIQASFDSIFGKNPVMLRVSKGVADTYAIEEREYLTTRLTKFCNFCQLHLFCSILELQFVGTKTYDTHRMIHDIYLALSELKLVFRSHGRLVCLTPDALCQRFIEFSPSFPQCYSLVF